MTDNAGQKMGKIKVTIGRATFAGKGSEDWLAEQLDKVLESVSQNPAMVEPAPDEVNSSAVENGGSSAAPSNVSTLATYLKDKNATTNQTKRFLATAGWLTKKGQGNLKTGDVSKALKDNHQSRLSNPTEYLNQNVKKGHCEKSSGGFFVTPEGWTELGDSA